MQKRGTARIPPSRARRLHQCAPSQSHEISACEYANLGRNLRQPSSQSIHLKINVLLELWSLVPPSQGLQPRLEISEIPSYTISCLYGARWWSQRQECLNTRRDVDLRFAKISPLSYLFGLLDLAPTYSIACEQSVKEENTCVQSSFL